MKTVIKFSREIILLPDEVKVIRFLCKEHIEIIELNVRNKTNEMKHEIKVMENLLKKLGNA